MVWPDCADIVDFQELWTECLRVNDMTIPLDHLHKFSFDMFPGFGQKKLVIRLDARDFGNLDEFCGVPVILPVAEHNAVCQRKQLLRHVQRMLRHLVLRGINDQVGDAVGIIGLHGGGLSSMAGWPTLAGTSMLQNRCQTGQSRAFR